MSLKKSYQDELIKIILSYIPQCTIYLFGSRATDQEQPGSDIDIAVDAGKAVNHTVILKILIAIDDTTIPMSVDLIDLHGVSADFKNEVLSKGIPIRRHKAKHSQRSASLF